VRAFGRICDAACIIARCIVLLWCIGILPAASFAEEVANRTTVVVFGDSQGAGLARGLQRILIEDPRYRVLNRTYAGAALVHGENEWLAPIQKFVANEKADIAVAMFGANDRLDFKDAAGATLRFRTDPWRDAYAARIDQLLKPMVDAGLKVIWCGNPIARSGTYSAAMPPKRRSSAPNSCPCGRPSPIRRVITPPSARIAMGSPSGCGPMTGSISPRPATS
jgi:hypothetical protein